MNATLINPFVRATLDLFKDMFAIDAKAGSAYTLKDGEKHSWEISGILGITGDFQGILAFRLARPLADTLLEKSGVMTHDEAERRETVNGMIGELTNIISGNASGNFDGLSIDISPPVVVLGDQHHISWPKIGPVIGIPFSSSAGDFELDICFK